MVVVDVPSTALTAALATWMRVCCGSAARCAFVVELA